MAKRAALYVSLTPELVTFIAAQVTSGRYGSANEIVRASLRLLQDKESRSPAQSQIAAPTGMTFDGH